MKVAALISGGKDSCYAMYLCQQHGHEVVALANLLPLDGSTDDLDSFMFQTVGHQVIDAYSSVMGLPLYRRTILGGSKHTEMSYEPTIGDEVEDLFLLLSYVKEMMPEVTAVSTGAIASDYQRVRVEHVCSRLGLVSLAYMWHQPQRNLLRDMISSGIEAVLIKVASLGLSTKHLGKSLSALLPHLTAMSQRYGVNVCGEGGEYESLVLDCPLFKYGRIVLDEYEVVETGSGGAALLHPTAFHVEPKSQGSSSVSPEPRVIQVPQQWSPSPPACPAVDMGMHQAAGDVDVKLWWREGGNTTQVSGIAYLHANNEAADPESEAATRAALHILLQAIKRRLEENFLCLDSAVLVALLLRNMDHFAAANTVYCSHFPATNPPSRACVQAPLPHGALVMVDVCLLNTRTPQPLLHNLHISSQADQHASDHFHNGTGNTRCSASSLSIQTADYASNAKDLIQSDLSTQQAGVRICISSAPDGSLPARAEQSGTADSGRTTECTTVSEKCLETTATTVPLAKGELGSGSSSQSAAVADRRVLHVQSISDWAPSCIGPYSQATCASGLIWMAGQIPLDPGSMTLVDGDAAAQTRRALQSCEAVAIALKSSVITCCHSMTVFVAESVDSKGREAVQREVDAFLQGADEENSGSGTDEDECPVDPYLLGPADAKPCKPDVMYVILPALPRRALVEVQPVLLHKLSWKQEESDDERSTTVQDETPQPTDVCGSLNEVLSTSLEQSCVKSHMYTVAKTFSKVSSMHADSRPLVASDECCVLDMVESACSHQRVGPKLLIRGWYNCNSLRNEVDLLTSESLHLPKSQGRDIGWMPCERLFVGNFDKEVSCCVEAISIDI